MQNRRDHSGVAGRAMTIGHGTQGTPSVSPAYPSLRAVKGPDLPAWKPPRSGRSGRAPEPERYRSVRTHPTSQGGAPGSGVNSEGPRNAGLIGELLFVDQEVWSGPLSIRLGKG